MSGEKKKSSKPVRPTDVTKQLQTSITKVGTLPKGIYKMTEAKKIERRFARDNQESKWNTIVLEITPRKPLVNMFWLLLLSSNST